MRRWRLVPPGGLRRWVGVALTAGAAAALVGFGPPLARYERAVAGVPPITWLLSLTGLVASHVMRGLRLHSEWHPRHGVGRLDCLRVTVLHTAAVNLLPMRGGELSYPWMLHRRWGVPVGAAALSLLWLRVQDALVLAALAGLAALALLPMPPGLRAAVLVACALAAWALARHRFGGLPVQARASAMATPPFGKVVKVGKLHALRDALGRARAQSLGGARAWGFCVANWLLKLVALALVLAACTGLPIERALLGALGGEASALLPVQPPAGAGTYEAGVLFGLQAGALGADAHGAAAPGLGTDLTGWIGAAVTAHLLLIATSSVLALLAWVGSHSGTTP